MHTDLSRELAVLQESENSGTEVTRKELRMLKTVIGNLEADLMQEKTKYQRALQKKQKTIESLTLGLSSTGKGVCDTRQRWRSSGKSKPHCAIDVATCPTRLPQ
jgi:predicted RNase H-like nuclease (RuvC/YqgF family)